MENMSTVNKEVKQPRTRSETGKWIVVALIIAVGVWGNAYFNQVMLLYRVLALVVLGIIGVAIAKQTRQGHLFWEMLKEAKAEVRRVIWPTRQETMQTTLIVVVVVLLMGLVLWGIDTLLSWLVQSFIS